MLAPRSAPIEFPALFLQFNAVASFDLDYLNTVFLPLLGLSLGFSMLTVRPYHR